MSNPSSPASPQIIKLSPDRRTVTVNNITSDCEIGITFRGEPLTFTRSPHESSRAEQLTLEEPLGPWEVLGGFTVIFVNGTRIGAADELIQAERGRVRRVILHGAGLSEAQSKSGPGSLKHGIAPPSQSDAEVVVSGVELPVGSKSADGSAAVGRGGHLYLTGGSNSLLARYSPPRTPEQELVVDREVREWVSLIDRRRQVAHEMGAQFLQMIVPDKSTMLNSGIEGLGPVTPALQGVEEALAGVSHYVSGRSALALGVRSDIGVSENWQRLDTHLSPRGSWRISSALSSAFSERPLFDDIEFSSSVSTPGDLSQRFFGTQIRERSDAPAPEWAERVGEGRTLQFENVPENGTIGRILQWYTPRAPIDAKVLVFGNSFFGATDLPISCNHWVSRTFRDHRFVWSPTMLAEEIRSGRPDLVICQTVERFMGTVPSS